MNRRLAMWWMQWEDLNWPQPQVIDRIKRKAEGFAKADITTAIFYGAHFRWDYMPFFTLLHDYIATVCEELHKNGLEFYDHHSVNLIHRYDTRDEMRHVMLHSGPHIPFCPSREAAKTWEFHGKRLNDWRQIDVKTGKPLYFPQYASEGFCHRNPEFREAYKTYAKQLMADTGIDGLMADDAVYFMRYNACGCEHCRAELRKRTGVDLPPMEDQSFWGNWENPAWKAWIDLRYDAAGEFYLDLRSILPKDFPLCNCGGANAAAFAPNVANDARNFLKGGNYLNVEMGGNTPPYKPDPITNNYSIPYKLSMTAYHQAAARESAARCCSVCYGFTEPAANICWAMNKTAGFDCHIATLKRRLGLPQDILDSLPDVTDIIGRAFTYEKNHPELFRGEAVGQAANYFSTETRDHTCFGNLVHGYTEDFQKTQQAMFTDGISTHVVFKFPETAEEYPVVVVSSVAEMTEQEKVAMKAYLAAGGKIIATGPTALAECKNSWQLPTHAETAPEKFFDWFDVKPHLPDWMQQQTLHDCKDADAWQEPLPGLYYNPHRITEENITAKVLELCRKHMKRMPIDITESQGYLISTFQDGEHYNVHFLAADYDTDIDHHLDEIRYHRSRVNFINKVEPAGVSRKVCIRSEKVPQVFTPFCEEETLVESKDGLVTVTLPKKCAYAVMRF